MIAVRKRGRMASPANHLFRVVKKDINVLYNLKIAGFQKMLFSEKLLNFYLVLEKKSLKNADNPEKTGRFSRIDSKIWANVEKKHNFVKTTKKEKNYICSG